MQCLFFIHSLIDGYLGCLHILGVINNVTKNKIMISVLLDKYLEVGLLDHSSSIFNFFEEISYCFPYLSFLTSTIAFPTMVYKSPDFSKCLLFSISAWFHLSKSFPGGTMVKNPSASAGDARNAVSVPGSGRSPGEGNVANGNTPVFLPGKSHGQGSLAGCSP